jgi:membrane fusion protein, protease secretion system
MAKADKPTSPPSLWQRFFKRSEATARPSGESTVDDLDDPSDAIRFGYQIIFLGIGLFAVWATMAPLGEGIPAPAIVTVESKHKTITHLTGGTIAQVHLSEHEMVRQGETLIEFKSERAQTAYDTAMLEFVSASARLARLEAEIEGSNEVSFPEEIERFADQLERTDLLRAQQKLFRARVESMRSEVAVLSETLIASRAQADGLRSQLVAKRTQQRSLSAELDAQKPLVESGYTARNRYLEQERQLAEMGSVISDIAARNAREASTAAEIRLRILQRRQDYLKEVETQTAETRREVASLSERLKDAKLELDRTIVHAPISGQIVSLMPLSPGVTVPPGAKLMEIIPTNDRLLIDAKVPATAASRLAVGLDTDIRVSSFPDTPSLILNGRVISVSSDTQEPPPGSGPLATPYYLARVEVTPEGLIDLEGRQLRAGMSVEVVIKTGERSFLKYLLDPITRRTFSALKEP